MNKRLAQQRKQSSNSRAALKIAALLVLRSQETLCRIARGFPEQHRRHQHEGDAESGAQSPPADGLLQPAQRADAPCLQHGDAGENNHYRPQGRAGGRPIGGDTGL